jgi:O-antigen ligase
MYGGIALVAVTVFVTLGYTALFDKYQILYQNVFNVFQGESPDEASSAVRFMEFNTALDYIKKNPLLGNGFISNQWNGGWHDILGYFYPVDIGILGNIFVFGILGTIVIYLPYYYSLTMSKEVKSNNVFFKTCEYMLLFFFLCMFFSAVNIRDSSSIMFLVCLLYYFRYFYSPDHVKPSLI